MQEQLQSFSTDKARILELLLGSKLDEEQEIRPYSRHEDAESLAPTSWSQQRLWFIDQLEGGSAAYNIQILLRLHGTLDQQALYDALRSIVGRHEVLRTAFESVEGEPKQRLIAGHDFALERVDLSHCDPAEWEEQVARHRAAESAQVFQLSQGTLIRGRLLCLAAREHVLLLTLHHIVSDGWSTGVLLKEFASLYGSRHEDGVSELRRLSIQYADYARWQREPAQEAIFEHQLRYWRSRLHDAAPDLGLPMDRPRPTVQSYRGDNVSFVLDSRLSAELRALSRHHGVTLFMLLYAGWSILLSRLSAQEDIVMGTPVANRPRPELEDLIGFFVNTVVLRVHVSPDTPFGTFLRQVKDVTLGAYEHQDVPFERLVADLRPDRNSSNPIFQVMFALQNAPTRLLQLPDLSVEVDEVVSDFAKFDLLLAFEDRGDKILGSLNFATDLFDIQTMQRWVACLIVLLKGMRGAGELSVGRLPILPEDERRTVVELFNATHETYPSKQGFHRLFEECARRAPDAVALSYENAQLTYGQLNDRANRLARYLREQGISQDRPVAICAQRGFEMVTGVLAILKAGGAYMPLDPAYPVDRIAYMLDDAKPSLLLMQEALKHRLPRTDATVIALDHEWGGCVTETPVSNLTEVETDASSIAYVIYTSGSTGTPKGVQVEHAGLCNLAYMQKERLKVKADSRVLQFASFGFDAWIWECAMALGAGACLCMAHSDDLLPGEALQRTLRERRITHATLPPVALGALDPHGDLDLSTLIVAGEACPARLAGQWSSRLTFINAYGPTEATVCASMHRCTAEDQEPLPIGHPIPNARIYVLDRLGAPVPIGVTGELHIAGVGLARGYLDRPELTEQRFIPDQFDASGQGRLYRTGDLVRWRADGEVEFLGRNDDQVKIRGFRIELGEIEAQLSKHEQVKEAAVVVREDGAGEKRLVAYLSQRADVPPAIEQLRGSLRKVLPEYMVPSVFVILESMPLTPHGKLDRKALPTPDFSLKASHKYEAPYGDVERALARIWQDLLKVTRVSRFDNFFDLGGHSLLAVKLQFKINELLGCGLRVKDVYENPILEDLAARIDGAEIAEEVVDLAREIESTASIVPCAGVPRIPTRHILLTGGTGFVGRFLLFQLLRDTDATIHCLVRAKSDQDARSRLKKILADWDLWRGDFEGRIVALAGDLRLPYLGLQDKTYRALCEIIDSIYHCGTSMNHLETYAMAKPANVGASAELLKLAAQHRPKTVNYISTLSVFRPRAASATRLVDECSSIDQEKHLTANGYVASKWVSEKIFASANERGIPCNIFRVGLVWADAELGRYDELQQGYRVLKSSLLSGFGIENYRYSMTPTPVDYTARAIVALASKHHDGGGVFHISSVQQQIGGLFESCNEIAGISLIMLPYYDWICEMKRLHRAGHTLPAVPLIEYAFSMDERTFYEHERAASAASIRFDCSRTHRELEAVGVVTPVLDDEMLRLCVQSMLRRDPQLRDRIAAAGMRDPRSTEELAD